jgi:hypothetical protein
MRALVFAAAVIAWTVAGFGQQPDHGQTAREAMAKLGFLVGRWEGQATMDMGPGAKHDVVQQETVEARLDGLLLVVEGTGRTKDDGRLVHHALGVISFDPLAGRYRVAAYRQDGQSVDAVANFLEDGAFQWSFSVTGTRSVRYTIRQSEDGEWLETGEITHDGAAWLPFLEMRLKRVP